MTPKEKARELINKFNYFHDKENKQYILFQTPEESKRCALIAVDECIKYATLYASQEVSFENSKDFLYQVKQEINKL